MESEGPVDAQIVRAIDQVLQAEAALREAVDECQQTAKGTVARAREERQRILDRAQVRIVSMHARCTQALERASAAAAETQRAAASTFVAKMSDPARRRRALERLAAALTGIGTTTSPSSNAP